MTVVSNGQLWMYTLALLIFWIIVLTTAFNDVSHIKNKVALSQKNDEDETKNTGICKNFCKHCGCLGFFCGEECICECNDENADTECIRKIQLSAQSSNTPFEVLIQGPTANSFVRNALLYEQNQDRKLYGYRNKRSTVTVYKPGKESQNVQKSNCEVKANFKDIFKLTENSKNRHKRSSVNNHFEWFNNLGSNLLKPAPLGGYKRQVEENKKATTKPTSVSSIFDNSWIFDNDRNVLTPRPLNKQKSSQLLQQTANDNTRDSPSNELDNSQEIKKIKDDFTEDGKFDYNFSAELNDTKSSPKKISPQENNLEESEENLIFSLYKRLFKNNFNKINEKLALSPAEKDEDVLQDYLTGARQSVSYNDDFNNSEMDKIDLFSEEIENAANLKEKVQNGNSPDLSTSQNELSSTRNLSPLNIKKGLQQLRIPWFKPRRLFKKFRQVIKS